MRKNPIVLLSAIALLSSPLAFAETDPTPTSTPGLWGSEAGQTDDLGGDSEAGTLGDDTPGSGSDIGSDNGSVTDTDSGMGSGSAGSAGTDSDTGSSR